MTSLARNFRRLLRDRDAAAKKLVQHIDRLIWRAKGNDALRRPARMAATRTTVTAAVNDLSVIGSVGSGKASGPMADLLLILATTATNEETEP